MPLCGLPPARTWLQLAVALPVVVLAGAWWWDLLGAGDEGAGALMGLMVPMAAVGVVLGVAHHWASDWMRPRFALLAWTAAGVVVTAWGGANWWMARATRERQPVLVADVEAGQPLPGRWLELVGRLVTEDRTICEGPTTTETYVPLVSDEWQPGGPVAVFVRAREEEWGAPGRLLTHTGLSVSGVVDPRGLREDVRQRFELLERPAAANAVVVDFEAKPAPRAAFGYAGLGIGALIVCGAALGWYGRN